MKVIPSSHVAAALLLALAVPASAEVRKWTSKAGTSLDAEMTGVDQAARTVTLKKADGSTLSIPIDLLSDEDKAYASAEWKKMQSAPAGTPPATPAPAAPAPAAPAKPAAAPAAPAAAAKPAPPRPALTIIPAKGFKAPNSADYISKVLKTRPRLIHAQQGWEHLKGLTASDPVYAKMVANLKAAGEKLLETPELTRVFGEQQGTVTPASKAMFRMATLGALHFLDGDPRWKERGIREMVAITDPATFQNWYVDEPAVTADFLIAACLGYDFFKDGFTAKQVTEVKTYMIEKGIGALSAKIKGEPVPESAKGKAAGVVEAKGKAPPPKPAKKEDVDVYDSEHMAMASALILSAICLADEDPGAARQAIDGAAKVFGKGMTQFAPAGLWPEGMEDGEKVLDYAIMVMQTLKTNTGADFGFSMVEGLPQAGLARLHLVGPTGSLFNYGDTAGSSLSRPWVSTWLAGVHGNLGQKALTAGSSPGTETALLNLAGHVMYYNPHAAGDGTPDSTDYGVVGGQIAAMRSAWDRNGFYVALKGGDNSILTSQLDIGTFVLEAGGKRWGIDLGGETDRAPGFAPFDPKDPTRTKRYQLYLEGTRGQNTLEIGQLEEAPAPKKGQPAPKPVISTNQSIDGKSAIAFAKSTPEVGMAAVDMKDAYSKAVKEAHRGVMVVRGAKPYVLIQDDLTVKNNTPVTWKMHTKATVAVTGKTATLTDAKDTLHAVILSPEGATFVTEDAPTPPSEQERKLTGVHLLKVSLGEVKGPQKISIAFSLGEPLALPPVVKPVMEWPGKK
ncbi:MAG: heparinase II/III family protein [Verrucomicrobiota bacterium]